MQYFYTGRIRTKIKNFSLRPKPTVFVIADLHTPSEKYDGDIYEEKLKVHSRIWILTKSQKMYQNGSKSPIWYT